MCVLGLDGRPLAPSLPGLEDGLTGAGVWWGPLALEGAEVARSRSPGSSGSISLLNFDVLQDD